MTRFLNRFSNHAKKTFNGDTISKLKRVFEVFLPPVALTRLFFEFQTVFR